MAETRFQCTRCKEWHEGLPDIGFDAPMPYDGLTDGEKTSIADKTDDFCSIRDEDFFIRAVLPIPEPADHLLGVHQRQGVELATLQEIVAIVLHPAS